jgi:hypothetical protein
MVVDDSGSSLTFTFRNGSTRRIKLWGNGRQFYRFLEKNFPDITLEYIEDW